MPKIFLSYRRQDSAGVAGRIYDRLRQHFGDDAIFMDIDNIPLASTSGSTSVRRSASAASCSP